MINIDKISIGIQTMKNINEMVQMLKTFEDTECTEYLLKKMLKEIDNGLIEINKIEE